MLRSPRLRPQRGRLKGAGDDDGRPGRVGRAPRRGARRRNVACGRAQAGRGRGRRDLRPLGALRRGDGARGDGSAGADADLLPVDLRAAPRHPGQDQQGLREDAQARREDRAGAGLRHRPLRRRGEEEEEHLGRLRRHDAVRRDGRADRSRHDRAVGQLHPEGGDRTTSSRRSARRPPTRGTSGRSRSCSTSSSRPGTASSSRRPGSTRTRPR